MARPPLLDAQTRMDGGLNSVADEAALSTNQMRQATNARLTDFGAVTKRLGLRRVSDAVTPAAILNGYTWRKDSGATEILAISNGALHTTSYGSFPFPWTTQTGAFSLTDVPTFAKFRDGSAEVTYIGDGGLLNKWDGTTVTTNIAGTVGARMITVHNERLWSCGCNANPTSIFYSALNNGDTLGNAAAGGGEIIVRTFGDEVTTALASVNDTLLIFHRRGISRLTGFGQDDITVDPAGVTSDVGLIAPNSIAVYNNAAFFVTERGLYLANESTVQQVGSVQTPDPLLPIIRQMDAGDFKNIRAIINRATRELWVTMPGFGCYVYHTLLGAWAGPWDTGWVDPETTALWETLNNEGLPVILRGDAGGFVSLTDAPLTYKDSINADGTGGTQYAMTVQMHRMYCGDQSMFKALRWGYLTATLRGSSGCRVQWATGVRDGSYLLGASTDQVWGGVGTVWGVGTWGGSVGSAESQSYRIPMGGSGYYIDVLVIDDGDAAPILSAFQLETFALGRR